MCDMIIQKAAERRPPGGQSVAAGMGSLLAWPDGLLEVPEKHAVSSPVGGTWEQQHT